MPNDFFQYGASPSATPAPAPARETREGRDARDAGEGARAILADLSDEEWEKFIDFASRRRYPDGALILDVGQGATALGFIASGGIEVLSAPEGEARSEVREEGDVFGMLGFLDGAPATVRVRARGSTEVLLLTREALLQLAAWQPRIAVALLRDLGAAVATRLRRVQGGD